MNALIEFSVDVVLAAIPYDDKVESRPKSIEPENTQLMEVRTKSSPKETFTKLPEKSAVSVKCVFCG